MNPHPRPKGQAVPDEESPAPLPAGVDKGSDDGLLDSIGKAITAPVEGAAEPEELPADPNKPPATSG